HYDIASFDLFAGYGVHRIFFALVDSRWAAMVGTFVSRDFYDRAFGREVALQNHKPAARFDRVVGGVDHILPRSLIGKPRFFADGQPADGKLVAVQIAFFAQPAGHQTYSARAPKINRRIFPAGLEVGDHRRAVADLVEILDLQINACLARHRQQVEDGV